MSNTITVKSDNLDLTNWESIQKNYGVNFIAAAIHAYEYNQEYRGKRNVQINKAIAEAKANGSW